MECLEKEIIFLGRGGGGVKTVAELLAKSALREGLYVQAFPEFGAERRGAKVTASTRISSKPIRKYYKIEQDACIAEGTVDIVVLLEPPLFDNNLFWLIRENGVLVVASETWNPSPRFTTICVNALGIARELGIFSAEGRPLGNMVVLGALIHVLSLLPISTLETEGMLDYKNVAAVRSGFVNARIIEKDASAPLYPKPTPEKELLPSFSASLTSTRQNLTGTWRVHRPEITDACTACDICAVFCPERVIQNDGETMTIDYAYCKGCMVCQQVCPREKHGAIIRIEEGGRL